MALRILLSACALALVAGCAKPKTNLTKTPGNSPSTSVCNQPIKRAVMDIGSTGASALVGFVFRDCDANSFNKYFFDYKYSHDFDGAGETYATVLSTRSWAKNCADNGYNEIKTLSSKVLAEKGVTEIQAVATAAFRNNIDPGKDFINEVSQNCVPKLDAIVLTPSGEGELEFRAVANRKLLEPNNIPLVWGFGSTSTQLTRWVKKANKDSFRVETDLPGGKAFVKSLCKDKIKCTNGKIDFPLSVKNIQEIDRAARNAAKKIDSEFSSVSQGKKIFVIGGSVKYSPINYKTDRSSKNKCYFEPETSVSRSRCLTKEMMKLQGNAIDENTIIETLALNKKLKPRDDNHFDTTFVNIFLFNAVAEKLLNPQIEFVDTSVAEGLQVIEWKVDSARLAIK